MYAYYCSVTIGTGKDDDAYRPEISDEPGIEGWAACYEQSKETRAIVLVRAPEDVHALLAAEYELLYTADEVRDA